MEISWVLQKQASGFVSTISCSHKFNRIKITSSIHIYNMVSLLGIFCSRALHGLKFIFPRKALRQVELVNISKQTNKDEKNYFIFQWHREEFARKKRERANVHVNTSVNRTRAIYCLTFILLLRIFFGLLMRIMKQVKCVYCVVEREKKYFNESNLVHFISLLSLMNFA